MYRGLPPLNLPQAALKLSKSGEKIYVWDDIRKKNLLLTPEEWVRQHFLYFLLQLGYPQSQIALESGLYLNQQLRRTDILVYRNRKPVLLVECKAPTIKLSQDTFDQASRYNLKLKVNYMVITNGLQHFVTEVKPGGGFMFLSELPDYENLGEGS